MVVLLSHILGGHVHLGLLVQRTIIRFLQLPVQFLNFLLLLRGLLLKLKKTLVFLSVFEQLLNEVVSFF